jgi:hypothetical protein
MSPMTDKPDDNKGLGGAPAASRHRATDPSDGAAKASPRSASVSTGAGVLPCDIVQITDTALHWYPCLVVVSELKAFGVQGFVFIPHNDGAATGKAYIRLERGSYEPVGARTIITTASDEAERDAALTKARGE